jgi:G3E family GTPase
VAVIVNDMSDVNIDAALVKSGNAAFARAEEKMVEMSNGCICCTLREDLLVEVGKLAREGRFDYLVIESTGVSEPMPVAETFTFRDEEGQCLNDIARLDTMVTVVDAKNFLHDFRSAQRLKERKLAVDNEDDRNLVDLLVDQIEFANVILINKADTVAAEELTEIRALIGSMNAKARIWEAERSSVPLDAVLGTGLYSQGEAEQSVGWLDSLTEHTPETIEYGITSFVYRARRPFHPRRFSDWCRDHWAGVIRAKGMFWLASRMDFAGLVQQAGVLRSTSCMGIWWSAMPRDGWPQSSEAQSDILSNWETPWGDRRQEIVLIGKEMEESALRAEFDACLLTDAEMQKGPTRWSRLADPFPKWQETAAH